MKKLTLIILLALFLCSCGFKVVKQSELQNYYISKVEATGENKINYIIRNNLLGTFEEENKKPLKLNIKTSKTKSIKEKNIKNEISKYEIKINVKIKTNIMGQNEINITKIGEYSVKENYSLTLNSENKIVNSLAEEISEEIITRLSDTLNDS